MKRYFFFLFFSFCCFNGWGHPGQEGLVDEDNGFVWHVKPEYRSYPHSVVVTETHLTTLLYAYRVKAVSTTDPEDDYLFGSKELFCERFDFLGKDGKLGLYVSDDVVYECSKEDALYPEDTEVIIKDLTTNEVTYLPLGCKDDFFSWFEEITISYNKFVSIYKRK